MDDLARHLERLNPQSTSNNPVLPTNAVDELAKQLERLNLKIAALTPGNVPQNAQANTSIGGNLGQGTALGRRCFMCAKQIDESHPIGLRNCPETHKLLSANLIRYDTIAQRYVQQDGTDLPRVPPGFIGGVAEYMRAVIRDRNANNTPQVARTSAIGLSYGVTQVLGGDNFAVTSLDQPYREADPVTRSGRDTERFDPMKRPEHKGKTREVPPHMNIPTGPVAAPAPHQTPAKPVTEVLPRPPNPINREDGWKGSRPANPRTKNEDIIMRDAKKPAQSEKYHITSEIQERADAKAIFETVLKTSVTLPLLELVGLSPQLQKLFTESTRSRREYDNKSAESSVRFGEVETTYYNQDDIVSSNHRHLYADADPEELSDFIVRYGNAIAKVPENRYFAMSTGSITIHIGDIELTVMIDTGSELNLASRSVPSRCHIPVDFEGMKWALKGIHGGPEQLRGCATDVPMKIGGHNFSHRIFVSHQELGQHDLILGQPFLQWFAGRLDYERSGGVSLYLWKGGDRKIPPTIVVTITDPQDPRNTTSISRGHSATIEEVSDEEDF
jgi:hypothetical protein